MFDFLKANKDAIQALQSIITMVAVVTGGVWAYLSFGRKREKYPRLKLSHKFDVVSLGETKRILRVALEMDNIGDTLVDIRSVLNRVQQVLPMPTTEAGKFIPHPTQAEPEINWPMIEERQVKFSGGHRIIEPKEPDALHFDYVLGSEIETVVIYSYVQNAHLARRWFSKKAPKELGWMKTETLHIETSTRSSTMSKTPQSNQTETRQGTPKSTPAQTTNSGALSAQGSAKPAPDKATNTKSK